MALPKFLAKEEKLSLASPELIEHGEFAANDLSELMKRTWPSPGDREVARHRVSMAYTTSAPSDSVNARKRVLRRWVIGPI